MKNAQVWLDMQPSAMVMAHTEWCGHCKKMKPDYIMAADDLYTEPGMLSAIDGDRFKSFLQPFGVTGFPTLLYFESGEFQYKYEGKVIIFESDSPTETTLKLKVTSNLSFYEHFDLISRDFILDRIRPIRCFGVSNKLFPALARNYFL